MGVDLTRGIGLFAMNFSVVKGRALCNRHIYAPFSRVDHHLGYTRTYFGNGVLYIGYGTYGRYIYLGVYRQEVVGATSCFATRFAN